MKIETMYRILVGTIAVLILVIGIYIGVDDKNKLNKDNIIASVSNDNVIVNPYIEEKEVVADEDLVMDVSVVYTDVYPDCGHTIEQEEKYDHTTINNIKKQIDEKDVGYRLIGTQEGILIYQKVNVGRCRNHYKVILEENRVKIYRMGLTGEYEIYQETEITAETIREGIKEQLINGIEVDEIEELLLLIEDIES